MTAATPLERYSIAVGETGDLSSSGDTLDLLIASGWLAQRNSALLGADICRLRAEFDGVRASLAKAGDADRAEQARLWRQLGSMRAVRSRLLALATQKAGRGVSQVAVPRVVDRCLDVFLDPRCRRCGGLGFTGGDGLEPRVWCRACGKSGNRRGQVGLSDAERELAADLLEAMDRAARFAGTGLAAMLDNHPKPAL